MTIEAEIHHIKPPVPPEQFDYKNLKQGEFWRHTPAYADVDEATFLDHLWQQKKSVKTAEELLETIREVCSPEFYRDAEAGFRVAPMAVRVSPYAIALIDWNDPVNDPIRRQFIPLASTLLPDHPRLTLDSLHEQEDSPVPGLVHRYVDKALFLPLNVCPVYCRFCTRSYAIGPDTTYVDKIPLAKTPKQWNDAFAYIARAPRARRHRHFRRRRISASAEEHRADRQRAARHPARAPDAVRDQRAGDHADEAHHAHGVARRADFDRRSRPHVRQGGRAPHSLQRARRDHVDHAKSDAAALRTRHLHAQSVGA